MSTVVVKAKAKPVVVCQMLIGEADEGYDDENLRFLYQLPHYLPFPISPR